MKRLVGPLIFLPIADVTGKTRLWRQRISHTGSWRFHQMCLLLSQFCVCLHIRNPSDLYVWYMLIFLLSSSENLRNMIRCIRYTIRESVSLKQRIYKYIFLSQNFLFSKFIFFFDLLWFNFVFVEIENRRYSWTKEFLAHYRRLEKRK